MTPDQIKILEGPLDRSNVATRQQSGRTLSYIESWRTIAEANRIFGFDKWTSETVGLNCVAEREREVGRDKAPGWGVTYTAKVKITVYSDDQVFPIIREGVGAGSGIDRDLGLAHESAVKEAESDARKRALMTFGNPFGLALYDKSQSNVADAPTQVITEAQHDVLKTLLTQSGDSPIAVCEHYGITSLDQLPADRYEGLRRNLSDRMKK